MSFSFMYLGDSDVYLLGLADTRTGSYVTAETVVATVLDGSGNTITSVSMSALNAGGTVTIYNYPSIGTNTTSAGGNYRGALLASVGLVRGTTYPLKVVSTGTATFQDTQDVPCFDYQG